MKKNTKKLTCIVLALAAAATLTVAAFAAEYASAPNFSDKPSQSTNVTTGTLKDAIKDATENDKGVAVATIEAASTNNITLSANVMKSLADKENVILSIDISGSKIKDKKQKALEFLKHVGLEEDEANRRVLKLSGGQQQRVAIARALSYNPDIILADEPTGNLDRDTQKEIMAIFRELAEQGKCVILVSHSPDVATMCDERYVLAKLSSRDGRQ